MSQLDFLFPVPALPPSSLSPSHFPGISPESTKTLRDVLKDNHERWHIFFNQKRFHNHAPHRAIALWALGADAVTIRDKYDKDCNYEKPAKKSPHAITLDNFNEHLGDDMYFSAYCRFFTQYVQQHGVGATLDHFLFSPELNIGPQDRGMTLREKRPHMLNRFLAGVLHPIIHTGYGAEFGLPGMLVEGLAEAAVHHPSADLLGPLDLFSDSSLPFSKSGLVHAAEGIGSAFSQTVEQFDNALDCVLPKTLHFKKSEDGPSSQQGKSGAHAAPKPMPARSSANRGGPGNSSSGPRAIDILAHLSHDARLQVPTSGDENEAYNWTIEHNATFVAEAIGDWGWSIIRDEDQTLRQVPGAKVETEADCKIEEIIWLVVCLYGVGGWTHRKSDGTLNADFFFMHLVTSSLFLPSLSAVISPVSKARLLRAYLATALNWYIARGKPSLDLKGFFASPLEPLPSTSPSSSSTSVQTVQPSSSDLSGSHPNIHWYAILQSAAQHPDEHLTKAQRALANWAGLLGGRTATAFIRSGKDGEVRLSPASRRICRGQLGVEEELQSSAAGLGMGMDIDHGVHVLRQGEALKGAERAVARAMNGDQSDGGTTNSRLESSNGNGGDGTGQADEMMGQHPAPRQDDHGVAQPDVQLRPTPPFDARTNDRTVRYEHQPSIGVSAVQQVGREGSGASGTTSPFSRSRTDDFSQDDQDMQAVDLDGSLFLRTALLTARRMGWVGFPGQKEGDFWDFQGFWGNARDDFGGDQRRKERREKEERDGGSNSKGIAMSRL